MRPTQRVVGNGSGGEGAKRSQKERKGVKRSEKERKGAISGRNPRGRVDRAGRCFYSGSPSQSLPPQAPPGINHAINVQNNHANRLCDLCSPNGGSVSRPRRRRSERGDQVARREGAVANSRR